MDVQTSCASLLQTFRTGPNLWVSLDCNGLRLELPFRPRGQIAQLVEHRTENPGVAGSIPALATQKPRILP